MNLGAAANRYVKHAIYGVVIYEVEDGKFTDNGVGAAPGLVLAACYKIAKFLGRDIIYVPTTSADELTWLEKMTVAHESSHADFLLKVRSNLLEIGTQRDFGPKALRDYTKRINDFFLGVAACFKKYHELEVCCFFPLYKRELRENVFGL